MKSRCITPSAVLLWKPRIPYQSKLWTSPAHSRFSCFSLDSWGFNCSCWLVEVTFDAAEAISAFEAVPWLKSVQLAFTGTVYWVPLFKLSGLWYGWRVCYQGIGSETQVLRSLLRQSESQEEQQVLFDSVHLPAQIFYLTSNTLNNCFSFLLVVFGICNRSYFPRALSICIRSLYQLKPTNPKKQYWILIWMIIRQSRK